MTVARGRRTVISIRGEDAEYLMPTLREVEVERMRKDWNKFNNGLLKSGDSTVEKDGPRSFIGEFPLQAYVCAWCGTEVDLEDHAVHKGIKVWYCQDNFECEKELFEGVGLDRRLR